VSSAIGLEFAIVAVAQQRVVVWIGFQIDVAAMAPVAARGPPRGNVFLAAEGNANRLRRRRPSRIFWLINEHENKNSLRAGRHRRCHRPTPAWKRKTRSNGPDRGSENGRTKSSGKMQPPK